MNTEQILLGVDIGGTKCAVTLAKKNGSLLDIKEKMAFPTTNCASTIEEIKKCLHDILSKSGIAASRVQSIGISCGGPLSSSEGLVLSPPNLPGWDAVPICRILKEATGIPAALQNDANACALAEWIFGAGRGTRNMAFLTFGTGMGAGLILDGKLYSGTNDNAGEIGHVRLEPFGPVGYGKAGSVEGFCSGGGIAQLARTCVKERQQMGAAVSWCEDGCLEKVTAKTVALAARQGDELALEIMRLSARQLGRSLSILVDILNPEAIVIGSIYTRNEDLFLPIVQEVLSKEALPLSSGVCRILPAALGEQIGDYAALSVAANFNPQEERS